MSWAGADQINIEKYVPGVGTAGPPSLRTTRTHLAPSAPDLFRTFGGTSSTSVRSI